EEGSGLVTYAAVRDPRAIETLWPNQEGDVVALAIGGSLDPASSPPPPARGALLRQHQRHGAGRPVALTSEHLGSWLTAGSRVGALARPGKLAAATGAWRDPQQARAARVWPHRRARG